MPHVAVHQACYGAVRSFVVGPLPRWLVEGAVARSLRCAVRIPYADLPACHTPTAIPRYHSVMRSSSPFVVRPISFTCRTVIPMMRDLPMFVPTGRWATVTLPPLPGAGVPPHRFLHHTAAAVRARAATVVVVMRRFLFAVPTVADAMPRGECRRAAYALPLRSLQEDLPTCLTCRNLPGVAITCLHTTRAVDLPACAPTAVATCTFLT